MKSFFFTTAPNHPGGSGYWEVLANNASEAREIMWREKGAQWAFQYTELEQVHKLDRKCHGVLS